MQNINIKIRFFYLAALTSSFLNCPSPGSKLNDAQGSQMDTISERSVELCIENLQNTMMLRVLPDDKLHADHRYLLVEIQCKNGYNISEIHEIMQEQQYKYGLFEVSTSRCDICCQGLYHSILRFMLFLHQEESIEILDVTCFVITHVSETPPKEYTKQVQLCFCNESTGKKYMLAYPSKIPPGAEIVKISDWHTLCQIPSLFNIPLPVIRKSTESSVSKTENSIESPRGQTTLTMTSNSADNPSSQTEGESDWVMLYPETVLQEVKQKGLCRSLNYSDLIHFFRSRLGFEL